MSFQANQKKKKNRPSKLGSVDTIRITLKGRFITTSANNVYDLDDNSQKNSGTWPFANFAAMVHMCKEQYDKQCKSKHTSGSHTDKHYMSWPRLVKELNKMYVNIYFIYFFI